MFAFPAFERGVERVVTATGPARVSVDLGIRIEYVSKSVLPFLSRVLDGGTFALDLTSGKEALFSYNLKRRSLQQTPLHPLEAASASWRV